MIEGVKLFDLKKFPDNRGFFGEIFKKEICYDYDLTSIQMNHSHSYRNVLRGLHYHFNQFDYWYVPNGTLQVGLVDLRKNSVTFLEKMLFKLDYSQALFIPPLVAHGFLALEDSDLIYVVNQYYNPDDELCVKWNDVGLDWDFGDIIISERDVFSKNLKETLEFIDGKK